MYTVTATSGTLAGSPVTFSATATVGAAATLALTSGNEQTGYVSTELVAPHVVTVTDNGGNPVQGVSVQFAVETTPSGSQGQTLRVVNSVTDASGQASAFLTLGDKVGRYTVTASATGLATVRFGATAQVLAPAAPALVSPANNAVGTPTSVTLTWSNVPGALTYRVQLSSSPTFATLLRDTSVLSATTLWVDGLANGTKYYWKVYASNEGGSSPWTAVWNFTTVIPPPARPVLISPSNGSTTVPIVSAALTWNPSAGAVSYGVQLSPSASFTPLVVDTSGVTGTSLNLPRLLGLTDYFWQVRASNDGGWSDWSDISAFRTVAVSGVFADGTIPDRFDLRQNFPNPFNPTTEIVFSLPDQSHVQILVYNSFGELVRSIVEGEFAPGVYHVKWDGMNSSSRQVPSGLYFCRMATPKASFTKRMVLLK
jgi:hypothetical protein